MMPCRTCVYKRTIPGDCHIECVFAWQNADEETKAEMPRKANDCPSAIRWFRFPFNFDPVWGPNGCPAYSESVVPEMVRKRESLFEILSLLG